MVDQGDLLVRKNQVDQKKDLLLCEVSTFVESIVEGGGLGERGVKGLFGELPEVGVVKGSAKARAEQGDIGVKVGL